MRRFLTILTACLLLFSGVNAEEALSPVVVPEMDLQELSPEGYAPLEYGEKAPYLPSENGYTPDRMGYHDDTLDIRIHETTAYGTRVCIAYIRIADASQIRTAQAARYPSEKVVQTNRIAKRANAVLAVNGDWFMYHNAGIIYRAGERLRNRPNEEYDALAIDANGDFHIAAPLTEAGFGELDEPIISSFCFGPALVVNGEVRDHGDRKVTYRQRTGIAQLAPLTYAFVVADGSDEETRPGLSMPEFSQVMKDIGAVNAYNLDGGSSSYLYFDGRKINSEEAGRVRSVGDIVYIATAVPDGQ